MPGSRATTNGTCYFFLPRIHSSKCCNIWLGITTTSLHQIETHLGTQFRKNDTLVRKGRVVDDVPVQDIELVESHGILQQGR